ncbi:unnamed protein product [Protopolystoma xenopodis]|uniref:Uncharacterized protein n=1 Tax=Protopolystoma xenopodis TaxID=117903 RepID=A0A448XMZ5_9PLAT|nr:unnamed protein product [Protopolystoma xenopodis]
MKLNKAFSDAIANQSRMDNRAKQLNEQLKLQEFCQEIDDVEEWMAEKAIVAAEEPARQMHNIAAVYSRFKAFEGELEANKDKIMREGEELVDHRPTLSEVVVPRLLSLRKQWDELNTTSVEKSAKMADANRGGCIASHYYISLGILYAYFFSHSLC